MKIKVVSLILAIVMMLGLFCSCEDKAKTDDSSSKNNVSSKTDEKNEPTTVDGQYLNNLTGCYEFETAEEANSRPVAVIVNNLNIAQKVQTGLADASIVYETVVEGGITRMLAIFKDVSKAGQIGTIRSARYSYLDFANGHDALYFHCGADVYYYEPYASQLGADNIDINVGSNNKYGKRVKNGLASEHTMYSSGELISKALSDKNRRTQLKAGSLHAENWQKFAPQDKTVTYSDGIATNASVFFSASYITSFKYDAESQKYVKSNKSGNNTDYKTGKPNSYKNVLILFANVTDFEDKYHVKINLTSGEGYYLTNGTMKNIKWSKGNTDASFKITDNNGQPVEFSAGNTYVCIPPKSVQSRTTVS